MRPRALPLATLILAGLWLALPATGLAQGNGNGNGRPKAPKADKPSQTASGPAASQVTTTAELPVAAPDVFGSVSTYRQFGSWLDDASAPTPGEGHTSVAVGHWRMQGMTQTNAPMLGVGVGLTERIQVSALLPFYGASYGGTVARGVDDIYLSAKYTILDPTLTLSEIGLAVSPVMEVLNTGASDGRVHFALPVSVELRRLPFRVYGSAGYFTRGSVFTGGVVEWTSPRRVTLSGALTQSYSVKADPTLDALGVGARRADVTGSVAYPLGQSAAGFVSVGRTVTSLDEGGTSLSLTGGLAVRFNAAAARP